MANPKTPLLLLLLSQLVLMMGGAHAAVLTYSVSSLGAIADGKTDSTKAFLSAWSKACASVQPAVIYVPAGRFLLRNAAFSGPCKNNAITFRIDGTLVAPSDYRVIGNEPNWILFEHVNGGHHFWRTSRRTGHWLVGLQGLNQELPQRSNRK
ncbi:unnamed protein product [Prunus armeniaca]|uniref:Rhamnogalacturonase A/B/Epimerase-like pectate lyase domain-containing protein n=1 Tax=Prunus armeniaca TaxID=36596 RepID=A0A6J5VNN2_PRUAR|nr:unnamed protein product [Prunus armeniaca]